MTQDNYTAWNPGLKSDIPRHLKPLITLYKDENAFVDYVQAQELSDLTGLKLVDLVALRPQRLLLHILLVRVTADLSVPDGPMYEELGINLRAMVHTLYTQYMAPELTAICDVFSNEKTRVENIVASKLSEKLSNSADKGISKSTESDAEGRSLLSRLFGEKPPKPTVEQNPQTMALNAIEQWNQLAKQESNDLYKAVYTSLAKTVNVIVGHRGNANIDHQVIITIATNMIANTYVANCIAKFIEPILNRAIDQEGFRRLPTQEKPVIMNVKGASASGKSTIRPQQRKLAERLDIPWEDFALVSPDYWRKYLLEYESLGEDYKYGAMLTGTELEIIDKKLDRYMEEKAANGKMPHLLIDRFRFDSFTANIDKTADSKLLSRFGDRVFLFFIITPPAATVERAWLRGMETGRYKAVDDLLYHNVEAFTGMPSLYLSWVNSKDRRVHFEFLDNSVSLGELPKTAAFGWNGIMTIMDIDLMLSIDRYRQVEITATEPDKALKKGDSDGGKEYAEFIKRCFRTVKSIDLADRESFQIYASIRDAKLFGGITNTFRTIFVIRGYSKNLRSWVIRMHLAIIKLMQVLSQ